jgi:hypothetical protein
VSGKKEEDYLEKMVRRGVAGGLTDAELRDLLHGEARRLGIEDDQLERLIQKVRKE